MIGLRHDFVGWSEVERRFNFTLASEGMGSRESAERINARFHKGKPVRTISAVHLLRTKHGVKVAKTLRPRTHRLVDTPPEQAKEQEVERTETKDGGVALRALGRRIKTVDDLLRYAEIDIKRFEVTKSSATAWDTTVRLPNGKTKTVQNFRVNVDVVPKAGPNVLEAVEAVIKAAKIPARTLPARSRKSSATTDVLQAIFLADPHLGKRAWARETGDKDYDLSIGTNLVRSSFAELIADGNARGVSRRGLYLLGDVLHYDTPHGTTTAGTVLGDRDGRLEKVLEEAAAALFDAIDASAADVPTEVVLVPGNHDAVMTVALRQILLARFRGDKRVTVDRGGPSRRYITHGKCLLGLTHGDKAQKRLAELMASEAHEAWGDSTFREIHHGHFHSEELVTTVGGVCIRQHRALCPPDGWHAEEGYVGAARGMQAYYYSATRGLVGMTVADPTG